jgi:hypothetical protein
MIHIHNKIVEHSIRREHCNECKKDTVHREEKISTLYNPTFTVVDYIYHCMQCDAERREHYMISIEQ